MADEVPSDVRAVLSQLLTEGRTASADGDLDTVADVVDTVQRVATNKLPEGDLRARLLHGCTLLGDELDDDPDTDALVAYFRAMAGELDAAE
jgi:hypothetical protein